MKKLLMVFLVFTLAAVFSAGVAMANGTLTATIQYKDANGVVHPLDNAYVYLQPGNQQAPREVKVAALSILGPSDASGNISVSVPEGTYHVRITRRGPLTTAPTQLQSWGPPKAGDYSWHYGGSSTATITITTGKTVALGTVYAVLYPGQAPPMTISGRVVVNGVPAAGVFVKATSQPCYSMAGEPCPWWGGGCASPPGNSSLCGPVKYPAYTDANGNYTINVPSPGTYYIYAEQYPGSLLTTGTVNSVQPAFTPGGATTCTNSVCAQTDCYGGCRCVSLYYNCPIAVGSGQHLTGANITTSTLY